MEPACGHVARLDFDERRFLLETPIEGLVAARAETTAFRRRNQIGWGPGDELELLHFFEEPRRGAEKTLGIGMSGALCAIYLCIRSYFDDLARIHNAEAIRYLGLERQVVRNKDKRKGQTVASAF